MLTGSPLITIPALLEMSMKNFGVCTAWSKLPDSPRFHLGRRPVWSSSFFMMIGALVIVIGIIPHTGCIKSGQSTNGYMRLSAGYQSVASSALY